jgi:hypothetical protein
MPLVRVTTTPKCSPNLRVGNHTYQPGQQVEHDMEPDDLDLLEALARDGAPLAGMFSTMSVIAHPGGRPVHVPPAQVLTAADAQADFDGAPRPSRPRRPKGDE